MTRKAFIDKHLHRLLSRKLLVWITTTSLLIAGKITGDQYLAISLTYIGSQGMADIAIAWKTGQLLNK